MINSSKTYSTQKLYKAYNELMKFKKISVSPFHERFIFPYICGTYFGYRKVVAKSTDVIITTLDQGISLAAEFEEFGFRRIAWWRTPSWIDVNYEIMNKYYTKMTNEIKEELSKLRSAHTIWYVYTKENL